MHWGKKKVSMFRRYGRIFVGPGNVLEPAAEKFKTHRIAPRRETVAKILNSRAVKIEEEKGIV